MTQIKNDYSGAWHLMGEGFARVTVINVSINRSLHIQLQIQSVQIRDDVM